MGTLHTCAIQLMCADNIFVPTYNLGEEEAEHEGQEEEEEVYCVCGMYV